jgi:hypothetical protein
MATIALYEAICVSSAAEIRAIGTAPFVDELPLTIETLIGDGERNEGVSP